VKIRISDIIKWGLTILMAGFLLWVVVEVMGANWGE